MIGVLLVVILILIALLISRNDVNAGIGCLAAVFILVAIGWLLSVGIDWLIMEIGGAK
jgi:hypothetical protein